MKKVKVILDKIMDTPAVEFVNVKEPDGIKLKALMECRKGGENQPKKDISKVTYGEFLAKFMAMYRKAPLGMVLSFANDWAYFFGKSEEWKELNSINYIEMIETVADIFENENFRKSFIDSFAGCNVTESMMEHKEETLESYYKVVSYLMLEANKYKEGDELYSKNMNLAIHIACNNILRPLSIYAGARIKKDDFYDDSKMHTSRAVPVKQEEIEEFFKEYMEKYNWRLIARMTEKCTTDDTAEYMYMDDLGISILINPCNLGFTFTKSVGVVSELISHMMTPWNEKCEDNRGHFEMCYKRFRDLVSSKIK